MWVRFLFITIACSACLLPPPVAVDVAVNQRPSINVNAATTRPPKAAVELNINCQTCQFSVQVDDADAADTLYFRWFLDYDRGGVAVSPINGCTNTVTPSAAGPRAPVTCDFQLYNQFAQFDGTVHTVEAWVSDRPFDDTQATPPNRAVNAEGNLVVREWTVTVKRRGITCDDLEQMSCVARTE